MNRKSFGRALLAASILSGTTGCASLNPFGKPARPVVSNGRLMEIGRTFEMQGRYQKARQMYNTVLHRQPDHLEVLARLDQLDSIERGESPQPPRGFTPQMSRSVEMLAEVRAQEKALEDVRLAVKQVSASTSDATDFQPVSHADSAQQLADAPPPPAEPAEETNAPPTAFDGGFELPQVVAADATPSRLRASAAPAHQRPINLDPYVDEPDQHVAELTAALGHSDPDTRTMAAMLLGSAGPDGRESLPALRKRLENEPLPVIQVTVAESINKLQPGDFEALAALKRLATAPDSVTRAQAVFALRTFGSSGQAEPVQCLADALRDPEAEIRALAALSLGDFGPAARSAVTALTAATEDESIDVRDAARTALNRIETSHAATDASAATTDTTTAAMFQLPTIVLGPVR